MRPESTNPGAAKERLGTAYDSSPAGEFMKMLRASESFHPHATFIDIGCGKGKVLFLASNFRFKKIVGIDYSQHLVESAKANLKTLKNANQQTFEFEILEQDATEYNFPNGPLLIYFFNPFGSQIMKAMLDNLERSLIQTPRDVIVYYFNPKHPEVWRASAMFDEAYFKEHFFAVYATRSETFKPLPGLLKRASSL